MKCRHFFIFATLLLGVVSLFIEQAEAAAGTILARITGIVDYVILGTVLLEIALDFASAKYKSRYLSDNRYSLAFAGVFLFLFIMMKTSAAGTGLSLLSGNLAAATIILRSVFLVLKIYGRIQKLSRYIESFAVRPAQTILTSFLLVILTGSLILMMGFTTGDGRGLPFMDALFTATSAVCVTGLIVVDTAVHFTPWGWAVIMVLIQIGGLGIMILSFFTIMTLRRRVSLADKVLLSYMLSEEDMMKIHRSLAGIVMTTFVIELAGAALLYVGFSGREGWGIRAVFFALFHAVSAFCNAGFALYSDSLEGFRGGRLVIATVSALIVSGGIGFAVIGNLRACLPPRLRHPFSPLRRRKAPALSLNSRIVLKYTAVLVIAGAAAVYFLEHGGAMKDYSLGDQYFSAFFQSVTLRTAGFNSIPFGSLRDATYMIMILFMFIGAASGSTAGGIKIGSLAVILSSLRAFMRGEKTPTLRNTSIPFERVSRAYLILLFGIGAVFLGTLVLTLTESASFLHLLFETVSAFGTVGLSAGVTGTLSPPGKLVIIMLMFFGRLGPLTILSAAGTSTETAAVSYPQCDIAIG